ncbi:hypothetical protein C8Q74DRAFT_240534 [Fomes fomentarius]|nr:hypothetical protein C8Q74DRAFT_240534 [Fomes fomentarius]
MSSPIAITGASNFERAESLAGTPPSKGLYIPVHRRTPSASSAPSSYQDRNHLSAWTVGRKSPSPRPRSVSPALVRYHDSYTTMTMPSSPSSPRATIPHVKKIPGMYTLTELLALSSSPFVNDALSPTQRAQVEAHVPLMTRKSSSAHSASPSPSAVPSSSSDPVSPPTTPSDLLGEAQGQKKADTHRRRRSGRKAPHAKARVPPTVATDVEGRRRRNAYGASWGWVSPSSTPTASAVASEKLERESWRPRVVVAA